MKRYGFTLIACALVGALATIMTGAASRDPQPAPIVLDDGLGRAVPATTPARPAHRVVRPRARRVTVAPDGARAGRGGGTVAAAAGERAAEVPGAPRLAAVPRGDEDRAGEGDGPAGADDGGGSDVVDSEDDDGGGGRGDDAQAGPVAAPPLPPRATASPAAADDDADDDDAAEAPEFGD